MHPRTPETPSRPPRGPAPFETAWRRRFQEFAELRDDDAGIAGWSASGLEARLRHFLAFWEGLTPETLWLDAGCGAGTYSRLLARAGAQVVAVDYSPLTLRKARERSDGADCAWVVSDVQRLPFQAGQFDGVLCLGVLQALSASAPAVRELARAVRPGGSVWIDALNGWCLANLWARLKRFAQGKPVHLRYESPWALRRVIREAGFENVRLYWMPILPVRWQRWQAVMEHPAVRLLLRWIPPLGLAVSHAFLMRADKPTK
ncbi:MAG: hypothetical protein KatS3mg123_3401 [Burkholderiales bacterium]|nr:MAG: hypothetical protein KatS3mg123_3401 [Burkholderiales bacterium]